MANPEPIRTRDLLDQTSLIQDPDDKMLLIMDTLKDTDVVPEVGKYYTFIYKAKTPRILYDEFPLIACIGVFEWGFRGINYHWGEVRNYDWVETHSQLHIVRESELSDLRSISYQKFTLNN